MDIYIPIQNKYYKWYCNICQNGKERGLIKSIVSFYTESHHIIPKSLNGSNKSHNRVLLTAKEHLICHWLLTKCYEGRAKQKMIFAFNCLCTSNDNQKRVKNSKIYEIARKKLSEIPSPKKQYNKCHCEWCNGLYYVADWKIKTTKYCCKKCFDLGSKGKTRSGRPKRKN